MAAWDVESRLGYDEREQSTADASRKATPGLLGPQPGGRSDLFWPDDGAGDDDIFKVR